jgi:hypothetical protein
MRNLILLLTFLSIVFTTSCQKDQITVNLKQSGSISVQIADSTGKKYSKIKVSLYSTTIISSSSSSYSSSLLIDRQSTDDNGHINFGELNAGTYTLASDTVKIGNKKYLMMKPFQVISGSSKNVVLNPMEYVGTIKLSLTIYSSSLYDIIPALSSIKVALINYRDYNSSLSRQKVIQRAVAIQNSDASGNVIFNNIPSNFNYYAYAYINNTDTIGSWYNSTFYVDKDGTYSTNWQIYASSLSNIKGTGLLNFKYYSNTTGNTNIKNANVLFVKSSDYSNYNLYNQSLSYINTYKVASGVTDNNGNVTIANLNLNYSYYVLIYYSDTYKTWAGSYYLNVPNPTSYSNYSVTGSYLGLSK